MARKTKEPGVQRRENKIVAENIRYLLDQHRVSQAQLARAIGKYPKTVYFWLHKGTEPDPDSRRKLCDYFNITEGQLFSEGLAIGLPSTEEEELVRALTKELHLEGVSPDDIRRLSSERKRVLEELIKDWSAQRSRQVQEIRAAQAGATPSGAKDARKRILLIDDEAQLSIILREKLRETGYRVELALDGETGLKQVEEFKPDLILLDLLMEGVDGSEFLRRLYEKNPRVKVIVVSSFPHETYPVYTGPYKIADYLEKPVPMEDLMEKIEKQIGRPVP